jgi:hypothetical protein
MRTTGSVEQGGWGRSVVVVLVTIAAALAGVLAAQEPASAHDHEIPKTVLMQGKEELQSGRKVGYSDWYSSAGGGECVHAHADYDLRFPRLDDVAAGSKLKIRIHKHHKPRPFHLAEVDKEGVPRGEVDVDLKPVVRGEKTVAWDAVFRVERPDTRYRLVSEGYWQDREDCRGEQHAFWSFQVQTGRVS